MKKNIFLLFITLAAETLITLLASRAFQSDSSKSCFFQVWLLQL
ncbi:hypothetical protein QUF73_00260 [Cytobacillus sp. NJ13]|nr:hypothetical protein [Cytobacillus sp. NJ13]